MVASISSSINNRTETKATEAIQKTLGQDAFLKLLVAELKHQDPLEPKNDKEFIAELAQFSSLEQMTNLNKKFEQMLIAINTTSVVSMLGKIVEGVDSEGAKITGIATSVRYQENKPYVSLRQNDNTIVEIPIENVTQVLLNPLDSQ
ncbi:MAG: flagellar hook capping FlgD N-terminal domain-containing protein [Candidatus Hydrogenedentota bacterium]